MTNRRDFIKKTTAISTVTILSPSIHQSLLLPRQIQQLEWGLLVVAGEVQK